ncbi:MAG: hypothetical protein NC117_09010 [Pseudoflavonifractor sp.]|nr:hypothetical protein [Pseudoflavonifractor sp.]
MDLKYRDDDDRCYGLTGMAISMVVLDTDHLLSSISLESPDRDMFSFTHEYYFSGDPKLSAKAAWSALVKNYQATVGMLLGNVMCRSYVYSHRELDNATRMALLDVVEEEGRDVCSLENDEIERLFDKIYGYMHKVFSHHGVQSVAEDFTRTLKRDRYMSRADVLENLRALSML